MATDRKAKLAEVNHWEELLALRDRQREQTRNGIQVIKEAELPLEVSRHGLMRWYLHPAIKDTCLSVLLFFQQEIPPGSRSGRLKFQGGQVMMITEGRGYTVIDGVKHPWKAGDVLNLPLRADGIIVQHWRVFIHDIKTRSGKHTHQGGLVIYVLEGKGYSIVDGERKDWEKGDLVLLPMKPQGVEHQHFNADPSKPALWAAFIHIPIQEYLASDLKQEEVSPDWRE